MTESLAEFIERAYTHYLAVERAVVFTDEILEEHLTTIDDSLRSLEASIRKYPHGGKSESSADETSNTGVADYVKNLQERCDDFNRSAEMLKELKRRNNQSLAKYKEDVASLFQRERQAIAARYNVNALSIQDNPEDFLVLSYEGGRLALLQNPTLFGTFNAFLKRFSDASIGSKLDIVIETTGPEGSKANGLYSVNALCKKPIINYSAAEPGVLYLDVGEHTESGEGVERTSNSPIKLALDVILQVPIKKNSEKKYHVSMLVDDKEIYKGYVVFRD